MSQGQNSSNFNFTAHNKSVGKITTEIDDFLNHEFTILHSVVIRNWSSEYKRINESVFAYDDQRAPLLNLKLKFNGSILFRTKNTSFKNSASIFLGTFELPRLRDGLAVCEEWLTSNKDKVFSYDSKGEVFSNRKDISFNIYKRKGVGFLRFKPTIIEDSDKVRYASIALICDKGVIGIVTPYEFLNMKLSLDGIINNFYMATMMLANVGLTMLNESEKNK